MRLKQAVFLVGGRGTRLGEIAAGTPKPLLSVGGRPFLDILIENAVRFGVDEILLLAGHMGRQVQERYDSWGRERGLTIRCIIEPEQAGTGGALRFAAAHLDEQFFLCNGDSLFDVNLLDLAAGVAEPWLGALALRQVPDASRYGQVVLRAGRITQLVERGGHGPGLVNGGIYVLDRRILERIGQLPCSIERDVFPKLAQEGLLIGKQYPGFFIDIGIPDDFARAKEAVPQHLKRPAVFFDRDGVLNIDHGYVHRSEGFEWIPGAPQAIKLFNDLGWYVFVVTNQAGVARGYYDEDAVHTLHRWINHELAPQGAHIDGFYYCPHHPEGIRPPYTRICDCRKPAPGLILAAARDWPLDLARSLLVGDHQSDLDAAAAAGIQSSLFTGGNLCDHVRSVMVEGAFSGQNGEALIRP